MYELDILCDISNDTLKIPQKILHVCIERLLLYNIEF